GTKTVLNEFIAYQAMTAHAAELSPRSLRITSFALCGFANFGSLAVVLGGLGGMVPERRKDLARLGLKSILAGSLATFLTGTIAGLVGPEGHCDGEAGTLVTSAASGEAQTIVTSAASGETGPAAAGTSPL